MPWLPPVDSVVLVGMPLAIIACWLLPITIFKRIPHPIRIALTAAAVTAGLSFVVWFFLGQLWLSDKPVGMPIVRVITGIALLLFYLVWTVATALMVLSSIVGNLVANILLRYAAWLGWPGLSVGLVLAVCGMIVPVGAVYARSTLGAGFLDLVTRYDEISPFPAKISVDLTVHGQRLRIDRTIICRRLLSVRERAKAEQAVLPPPYWVPSLTSFGHTFSDGSGVFVITPDGCRDLAKLRSAIKGPVTLNVLPANYRPLIGWTKDSGLDSFELYVDGTAYEQSDPPVTVHTIEMRGETDVLEPDPPDRFGDIGWQASRTPQTEYGSFIASPIPPTTWQKVPAVAAQLSAIKSFAFVLGDSNQRDAKGHGKYQELEFSTDRPYVARNGEGIPGWSSGATDSGFDVLPEPRPFPTLAMRVGATGWAMSPADQGVVVFYRGLKTTFTDQPFPKTVSLNNQLARRPEKQAGRYLYDPRTKILYFLSPAHFRLAPPYSIFASR